MDLLKFEPIKNLNTFLNSNLPKSDTISKYDDKSVTHQFIEGK